LKTSIQALDLIQKDASLPAKLAENTLRFRSKMKGLGFIIAGDNHPISPVMLGDAKLGKLNLQHMALFNTTSLIRTNREFQKSCPD